jgi:hypothetical protein
LDFTRFDAATQDALDRYHFNLFVLPIEGSALGSLTDPGRIGPFEAGTPGYEILLGSYLRQLQDHIEAKGWLDKAFIYWVDEPSRTNFPLVRTGMSELHKYAPKLARMLTVQPEPELYGSVDIWCVLTPNYNETRAHERQAQGEQVWWYICCQPHAPYVAEFIDHPAIEPRLWLWQTWKYGVQGILIWETCFWNKPGAAPDKRQNPWTDPMSWSNDAGATFGNGDGRLLYPPDRDPVAGKPPVLGGPVDSIRWEMLRDGIQDYEYLYMLRQKVEAAQSRGDRSATVNAAAALLSVPPEITSDMTTFTSDPRVLLTQREKIARTIESLH